MIEILEKIDITRLIKEYKSIESKIQWLDSGKSRQSSVQYKKDEDCFLSGLGKPTSDERSYKFLNSLYKGTLFEEIINKYNLARSRMLWLETSSCYSFHADLSPRIHIPIFSNEQAWFIFKNGPMANLKPGFVYLIDTRAEHTAINGHFTKKRLHMVSVLPFSK